MKKFLLLGIMLVGIFAFTLAMLPIEQLEVKQVTEYSLTELQTPVIYQAGFFDFFKNLDWGGIVALLFAGGLMTIVAAVRKAIKELNDVKTKYKRYWGDKVLTDEEKADLIKELGEAILALDSVWMVLSGLFKSAKNKT